MNIGMSSPFISVLALGYALLASGCSADFTDTKSPDLTAKIEKVWKACMGAPHFHKCYVQKLPQVETTTHKDTCYLQITIKYQQMRDLMYTYERADYDACVAALVASGAKEQTSAKPSPGRQPQKIKVLKSLDAIAISGNCPSIALADELRTKLTEGAAMPVLVDDLAAKPDWRKPDIQRFLVLTGQYADTCHKDPANAAVIYAHVAETALDEETVDVAVKQNECGFLKVISARDLWPFPRTFAAEVEAGRFEQAEITRMLWIETLERYQTGCGPQLSNRERIAAESKVRRLRRIIGLDDPILIEMRGKMIDAIKTGATDKILAYSRAVADREQTIDGANAAEYKAKLATIEGALKEQSKADKTGATAVTKSKNVAETAANVADTVKSVGATVETTRQILSVFGI